jgi:hypothetical protein
MRLVIPALILAFAAPAFAAEKDIFDFSAQKAVPQSVKKIVFVADTAPHGARGHRTALGASDPPPKAPRGERAVGGPDERLRLRDEPAQIALDPAVDVCKSAHRRPPVARKS